MASTTETDIKDRKGKRQSKKLKGVDQPKRTLFVRGNKISSRLLGFMKNLKMLRKQKSLFYGKKHEIYPFQDGSLIQKYCQKSQCSLFAFGSHSKKRPENFILGRTYQGKILDMVEFGLRTIVSQEQISNVIEVPTAVQPFVIFQGDLWEVDEEMKKVRNLLNDFFCCNQRLKGIEIPNLMRIVVTFSVTQDKRMFMRTYQVGYSGPDILQEEGKITLEQLGPHSELVIRRTSFAEPDLWKKAMYFPKVKKKKANKNIKYDGVGNRRGKLYVDHQNIKLIKERKRKFITKDKLRPKLSDKTENQFA